MTSTSHECSFVLEHGSLGDKKPVDFVNICGRIGPMVANMQNPAGRCVCKWRSRCVIPEKVYIVHHDVIQALDSAAKLAGRATEEMSQILGPVGVNDDVLQIRSNAMIAFDWEELIGDAPKPRHGDAFLKLYQALRPVLRHTLWPTGPEFDGVEHRWDLPVQDMKQQYRLFLSRVLAAASGKDSRVPSVIRAEAKSWFSIPACTVRPVMVFSTVAAVVQQKMPHASRTRQLYCASVVSLFLGSYQSQQLPVSAYETFQVASDGRLHYSLMIILYCLQT